MERPPLPLDDAQLEELMRTHFESVAPSRELRARTQQAIQRRLAGPRGPGPAWLLFVLAVLALGVFAALPGEGEPAPPAAPQALAPTPPEGDPAPSPSEPAQPSPTPEVSEPPLRLRLVSAGPGVEADYDYNQLHELLAADVVVVGVVESVDEEGAGTLGVTLVLKGERAQLLEVSTAGDFTGCEGVPDFRPLEGAEVCLFLRRSDDGALTLLYGAAGLQRLPYLGKLPLAGLAELVEGRPLPGTLLVDLIEEHGARLLPWLEQQLRGVLGDYGAGAPEVQAALRARLEALAAAPDDMPRPEVMGIVRALQLDDAAALPDAVWDALQTYHTSFRADPWGKWVPRGGDSYRNDPHDHAAYLSFFLVRDPGWVAEQVRQVVAEIRAGGQPRFVTEGTYQQLRARLAELGYPVD